MNPLNPTVPLNPTLHPNSGAPDHRPLHHFGALHRCGVPCDRRGVAATPRSIVARPGEGWVPHTSATIRFWSYAANLQVWT
jgi:hypothetical protein